jgi:hypothetical protein
MPLHQAPVEGRFTRRLLLKRSLDRQTVLELEVGKPGPQHDNIRGAAYYDPPPTALLQ